MAETSRFEEANKVEAQLEREAKPGDILLFYNATGINHIIPLVTRSPFFHVAVFAGGTEVIESRPMGVVRRDLRDVDDIHYFVVIPAPSGAGRAALAWAETRIGDGYDNTGVAVMLLDRIFTTFRLNYAAKDKWTCGQFVATAFDKAGVCLFPDLDLVEVEPADFQRFLPPEKIPRISLAERAKRALFAAGVILAIPLLVFTVKYLWRGRARQQKTYKLLRK